MAIPDVCHIILFDGWTFAVGLVGMFQMTKLSELHFIDDDGRGWSGNGMGWDGWKTSLAPPLLVQTI